MAVRSLAQSSLVEPFSNNSLLAGYESNYFHHLETVRLSSTAATIEFSNLARYSDFQHLQIRYSARSTRSSTNDDFYVRFNGDTGANHSQHYIRGSGTATESANLQTSAIDGVFQYQALTGSTNTATSFAAGVIDILNPFETTKYKTTRTLTGFTGSLSRVLFESGLWMSTDAVTSITLDGYIGDFAAGSRFSLYGLKARS